MLTRQQFIAEVDAVRDEYRNDNAWVGRWTESWNDVDVMTRFMTAAYNLYAATATNALQLTLLGGTEIRLDRTYIRNFGVTAANGIQDQQTKFYVEEALRGRTSRATRARAAGPTANAPHPDVTVTPVIGSGSILSEQCWTPILNDALILGAITGGQQFALAFTPDEQAAWQRLNGAKVTRVQVLAAQFDPQQMLAAWKGFFNTQKRMFFDNFGPRVFSRELLGLKMFGYVPEFSWHQLGFRPPARTIRAASFRYYLRELRRLHFHAPTDVPAIRAELSQFLFGDRTSLGNLWAP